MGRFLNYSYSLLVGFFAFACSPVQQEEKPVEIPFTQDDLAQIYSLAFDSLLGPPTNWLSEDNELGKDSLTFEIIFNANRESENYTDNDLLFKTGYCGKGKLCLQKFAGYDEKEFQEIVRDSTWTLNNHRGPYSINTSYAYKAIRVKESNGPYYEDNPYAAIYFETIAFSKAADYAIIIVSFYKDPEWGSGKAYFFKKENDKWRVVGTNRLYIS